MLLSLVEVWNEIPSIWSFPFNFIPKNSANNSLLHHFIYTDTLTMIWHGSFYLRVLFLSTCSRTFFTWIWILHVGLEVGCWLIPLTGLNEWCCSGLTFLVFIGPSKSKKNFRSEPAEYYGTEVVRYNSEKQGNKESAASCA